MAWFKVCTQLSLVLFFLREFRIIDMLSSSSYRKLGTIILFHQPGFLNIKTKHDTLYGT